jgi:hypothetical protein
MSTSKLEINYIRYYFRVTENKQNIILLLRQNSLPWQRTSSAHRLLLLPLLFCASKMPPEFTETREFHLTRDDVFIVFSLIIEKIKEFTI